jgi:hypothetical protein
MRRTLAIFVLALAIPSVAVAAKPPTSPSKSKAAPNVTYILKGTLWNYTAATATADGSITIHVTHSNYHGRLLRGLDLSFAVSAKTTVTNKNGATRIRDGARGVVKFRAPLRVSNNTLMAALAPSHMTTSQVIVQAR